MILTGFGDYESANESSKEMDADDTVHISGDTDDIYEVADVFKGVVRTKGNFWLANANAYPINFQSAGTQIEMRLVDGLAYSWFYFLLWWDATL